MFGKLEDGWMDECGKGNGGMQKKKYFWRWGGDLDFSGKRGSLKSGGKALAFGAVAGRAGANEGDDVSASFSTRVQFIHSTGGRDGGC